MRPFFIILALLPILLLPTNALSRIKITTYNIRNFDYDSRADIMTNKSELLKIIKSIDSDLIGIQEIVNKDAFIRFVVQYLPDYKVALTNCGGGGRQKLGFLYKSTTLKLLSFREDDTISDRKGCNSGLRPAAIGSFKNLQTGDYFSSIVVHLKAGGRQQNADLRYRQYGILTQIINNIKLYENNKIVIMGDFNTTDYILRNQNYARFIDFVDHNELLDFSSELECTSYWWGGRDDGLEYSSLLDHVLVTEDFFDSYSTYSVQLKSHCMKVSCRDAAADLLGVTYQEVSDHCPVVTSFK